MVVTAARVADTAVAAGAVIIIVSFGKFIFHLKADSKSLTFCPTCIDVVMVIAVTDSGQKRQERSYTLGCSKLFSNRFQDLPLFPLRILVPLLPFSDIFSWFPGLPGAPDFSSPLLSLLGLSFSFSPVFRL